MGRKTDGTIWAWGENGLGQLGDGTTTNHSQPTQVGSDGDWQTIVAGQSHSLAVKANGTLWAWGANSTGQVGNGSTTNQSVPVQIGMGSDWRSAAAGLQHSIAVKTDGTLWAWGFIPGGLLGDGTTIQRTSPVQIGTGTDWTAVACGASHSVALKSNGTLWAWGNNASGQSGDLARAGVPTPTQVGTSASWSTLCVGSTASDTLIIAADGVGWGFGDNTFGQLASAGRIQNAPQYVEPGLTDQTITAPELPALGIGVPFTLTATATSGLPVTYTISGPATLAGNQLTPTAVGTITVTSYQAGDEFWQATDRIVQTTEAKFVPDLAVQNLAVVPASLQSGNQITVTWKDANVGALATVGSFVDSVRVVNVSTSETLIDVLVNYDESAAIGGGAIGIGEFRNRQTTFRLPDGPRSVGDLAFTVATDSQNNIDEGGTTGEANNVSSLSVAATLADYPTLAVSNVSAPASALLGQQVPVSWTVINQGPAAAVGTWTERVYLSTDGTMANAQFLGSFTYSQPLGAGSSIARIEQITLPGIGTGPQFFIVTANAGPEVFEVDYVDNTLTAANPIQLNDYGVTVAAGSAVAIGGTPITISGTTFDPVTGDLVGNASVLVSITHDGTLRTIRVVSDGTGHYQTVFQPLPGEAGDYAVSAGHPSGSGGGAQGSFSLLGMKVTPSAAEVTLIPGVASTGQISVQNLGTRPLTGITATITGAPPNLSVQVSPFSQLAGAASAAVTYSVTASDESVLAAPNVQITFTSSEGVAATMALDAKIKVQSPRLVATPGALAAGMNPGSQRLVTFDIGNEGSAPTGPLRVALPKATWLSLGSPMIVSSIAPGEKSTVTLVLTPEAALRLGPYAGNLQISGEAAQLTVPFQFNAVAALVGNVHVQVVDEYTYGTPAAPKVAGASVELIDPTLGEIIRSGTTTVQGDLLLSDLPEGSYNLEVRAQGHGLNRSVVTVTASQTTEAVAFLSTNFISYNWTVTPTEIQDEYIFDLDVTFETNVPAPVVTVEPASVDLSTFSSDTTQINFTLTNHGLIAAQQVELKFADDAVWKITPLAGNVGTLAAKQTVVIPVKFQRVTPAPAARMAFALASAPPTGPPAVGKCNIPGAVDYGFPCGGQFQPRRSDVNIYNADGNCGPFKGVAPLPGRGENNSAGGGSSSGGGGSGGSGGSGQGTSISNTDVTGPPGNPSERPKCRVEPVILRDIDPGSGFNGATGQRRVSDDAAKALPGQRIALALSVPSGHAVSDISWQISGKVFKSYFIASDESYADLIPLHRSDYQSAGLSYYWIDSGNKSISVTCKIDGQIATATAMIDVYKPRWEVQNRIGVVKERESMMGLFDAPDAAGYGIVFFNKVTTPLGFGIGHACQVQLANTHRYYTTLLGTSYYLDLNNITFLDGSFPYPAIRPDQLAVYPADSRFYNSVDSPSERINRGGDLDQGVSRQWIGAANDRFTRYYMFRPPGASSTWVSLAKQTWFWYGEWKLGSGVINGSQGYTAAQSTSEHPIWDAVFNDLSSLNYIER